MQWFSGREIPLANGLNIGGLPTGNAIAFFTVVLLANVFEWKVPLASYGAITLLFALAWLTLGKEHKKYATESAGTNIHPSISIIAVLRRRTTLLLGLSAAGPFLLFMAIAGSVKSFV